MRRRSRAPAGGEHALIHGDLWALTALPATLAIVGAAATGCQLASICAAFGARVRLLDHAPRLLAGEDPLVSREVGAAFARRGIEVVAGIAGVERIEPAADGYRLSYARGGETRTVTVGAVVAAIGWVGNLEGLDLAAAGVATAHGHVVTDDTLRTTAPHIFAAGDLTGRLTLVQGATTEGALAAENAVLARGRPLRHAVVPHGGFTDPEYAGVGPTEEQARRTADLAVATVPYADLDRAVIDGHTAGACKLLACRATRRVLGAHIVGEQAVEVVQVVAAAVRAGLRVEQLAELELAYPTYTAVVGLAARRIARQLGAVPVAPGRRPDAEWERAGAAPDEDSRAP
ncbi:MAG TPA: FAD-dependent oxidoreductase [Thermomicrobiales bacterium]|nr:FAD-dependent oxidoreductase [Thermomicrobiales bacterium]